ncbi:MAG TPA: hypothetical protein PK131_02205 [Candidatus Woesebacteria bacterium]|nr:hypothetical protein [Candidatus Woesebacteria bacterium]HRS22837.1 hypothetical protein [Candidatus Woesebacteria bacterium]HRT40375.1 hypothetical protein [Candidatus Woesebacteria bacterium]
MTEQIVTRPYVPNSVPTIGIEVQSVNLNKKEFLDLNSLDLNNLKPGELTQIILDQYQQQFGLTDKKPNIYFHLCQKKPDNNENTRSPSLQIFTSDVRLGNLNREGFYRLVVDGRQNDNAKTKKRLKEILRYLRGGVVEIRGIYAGEKIK